VSLLGVKGAIHHVMELNSLSKSHNMAGWRIGALFASPERITDVLRFKSNMDSGMFLPLQLAAAKALALDETWYRALNKIYQTRRELVYEMLSALDCTYHKNQPGLFVWAKIPPALKDGFTLSDEVLYNKNVFITPGGIFGSEGNHFVRVSLCTPEDKLIQALKRLKN
jgi:aspartate/methionine/tyrosine aminotransferase